MASQQELTSYTFQDARDTTNPSNHSLNINTEAGQESVANNTDNTPPSPTASVASSGYDGDDETAQGNTRRTPTRRRRRHSSPAYSGTTLVNNSAEEDSDDIFNDQSTLQEDSDSDMVVEVDEREFRNPAYVSWNVEVESLEADSDATLVEGGQGATGRVRIIPESIERLRYAAHLFQMARDQEHLHELFQLHWPEFIRQSRRS